MRILIWSELFWPSLGGSELFASRLSTALRARGHELAVLTGQHDPALPEAAERDGLPIYRLPCAVALESADLAQVFALRRRVRDLKARLAPDLVHMTFPGPSAFFELQTRRDLPLPLLVRLNSPGLIRNTHGVLAQLCLQADRVECVSEQVASRAFGLLPALAEKSSVVYGGFEPPPGEPAALDFERPRLLCLGRLERVKGFDLALAAFASVVKRFPHATLRIVGDGSEREALERQARELGIAGRTEFAGFVEPARIAEVLGEASLVLMPSRSEGLPNAAIEAASLGRPIVASHVGGLAEIVADGETGLLVPAEDAPALERAIRCLLEAPDRARAMGVAARRRAQTQFGWERCVDVHEALYRRMLAGSLPGRDGTTMPQGNKEP